MGKSIYRIVLVILALIVWRLLVLAAGSFVGTVGFWIFVSLFLSSFGGDL